MALFGKAGSAFVSELTNLFNNYGNASGQECIALKAAMVMPALLLQRPHVNSKSRDHLACLERRLPLWKDGNILTFLEEGKNIQQRLPSRHGSNSPDPQDTARVFARLMFQGKVKAALHFILDQSHGSFLLSFFHPVCSKVRGH